MQSSGNEGDKDCDKRIAVHAPTLLFKYMYSSKLIWSHTERGQDQMKHDSPAEIRMLNLANSLAMTILL